MPDYVEGYGYNPVTAANRIAWYNYYMARGVSRFKAYGIADKKKHKTFNKDK